MKKIPKFKNDKKKEINYTSLLRMWIKEHLAREAEQGA
jgi:predicted DNA-binding ribbon-helix-helix protein